MADPKFDPNASYSAAQPDASAPATFDPNASYQPATPDQSGEMTNDVGNTVTVPKDGESFADTMKRAAAKGKTTTQDQLNKEEATMPGKVATTLAAAPAIGFGGTAAMAGLGELGTLTSDMALKIIGKAPVESGATSWLEQEGSGLLRLAAKHPEVLKLATHVGIPATSTIAAWLGMNHIFGKK